MTTKTLILSVGLVCIALGLFHRQTFEIAHREPDELVYSFLALRLAGEPMRYDLQGHLEGEDAKHLHQQMQGPKAKFEEMPPVYDILYLAPDVRGNREPLLDPTIYDRPIFHHPPAFCLLLSWVRRLAGHSYGPLLTVGFHLLTVILVAFLACQWTDPKTALLASIIMACEGVTFVASERLWIDGMLSFMVLATFVAAERALQKNTMGWAVGAGLLFAVCCLTKLPGVLIAPAIFFLWRKAETKPSAKHLQVYLGCAIVPVALWMLASARIDGALLRTTLPTPWMMEHYPYMKTVVERSPLYYFASLLVVSPVLYFGVPLFLKRPIHDWMKASAIWVASFLIFMIAIGMSGLGFQVRFLTPILPILAILAGHTLSRGRIATKILGLALCAYSLSVGLANAGQAGAAGPGTKGTVVDYFSEQLPAWILSIW